MTIYSGTISYKASKKNGRLTGEIRSVEGATDNKDLAIAFGVEPVGTGFQSYNGKLQLTELTNVNGSEPLYVDYGEMNKIDDIPFIRDHLNSVVDWRALARFMGDTHDIEIRSKLIHLGLNINFKTLSDTQRSVIVRYIFDRATEKELVKSLQASDPNLIHDVIRRTVMECRHERPFEAFGLIGTVAVISTDDHAKSESERLIINKKTIRIPFELRVNVEGSKAGFNSKSQEARQFIALKRFLTNTLPNESESYGIPLKYIHRFDPSSSMEVLIQDLKMKVFNDINNSINEYLKVVNNLTPESIGLDMLDNFNPITAWKKLLTEVGISSISFTKIDKYQGIEDLRLYSEHKITAKDFLIKYSDKFIEVFKKDLGSRFSEGNYSPEAYFERAKENAPELNILPNDMPDGLKIVEQVIADYRNMILSTDDIRELLALYHKTNLAHDQAILSDIHIRLTAMISNRRQDENSELSSILKSYFGFKLLDLVTEKFKQFTAKSKKNVQNLNLIGIYMDKRSNMEFADFIAQAPLKISEENYRDIIDNYVGGMDKKIYFWFENNIDKIIEEKSVSLNMLKEKLVEMFETEIERHQDKDIPFDIYDLAEQFGVNPNNASDSFIDNLETIANEMGDTALINHIEAYFSVISSKKLEELATYSDEELSSFVKEVYNSQYKIFVQTVINEYRKQIEVLVNLETDTNPASKMPLSMLAQTRNSNYYSEVSQDFMTEYFDTVTGGKLDFNVRYPEIRKELENYKDILASWLNLAIREKAASDNEFVRHIDEVGEYETDFLSWEVIQAKMENLFGHKIDVWEKIAQKRFIDKLRENTGDLLLDFSDDRILNIVKIYDYEAFIADAKVYTVRIKALLKDNVSYRNDLVNALLQQVRYAANIDGNLFSNIGLTTEKIIEDVESTEKIFSPKEVANLNNLVEKAKQKYFEECNQYISSRSEKEMENWFYDINILEVNTDKLHEALLEKSKEFKEIALSSISEELDKLAKDNSVGNTEALKIVEQYLNDTLSGYLKDDLGFTQHMVTECSSMNFQAFEDVNRILKSQYFKKKLDVSLQVYLKNNFPKDALINAYWKSQVSDYIDNVLEKVAGEIVESQKLSFSEALQLVTTNKRQAFDIYSGVAKNFDEYLK